MPTDALAVKIERYADVIAAQRVVAFGMVARVLERAVVARLPVVVEDDLLVQRFGVGHYANTFCTARMPAISASTSAMLL